jgi:hypothetical protein
VIESGWTESSRLHADMRLWLIGGQPEVQVVIVLRWSKLTVKMPLIRSIGLPHFRGMGEKFHKYAVP